MTTGAEAVVTSVMTRSTTAENAGEAGTAVRFEVAMEKPPETLPVLLTDTVPGRDSPGTKCSALRIALDPLSTASVPAATGFPAFADDVVKAAVVKTATPTATPMSTSAMIRRRGLRESTLHRLGSGSSPSGGAGLSMDVLMTRFLPRDR